MGGVVETIQKVANSTVGRVATGLATGGASEIGRFAAKTASRNGAPRIVAQGIGAGVGSYVGGSNLANVNSKIPLLGAGVAGRDTLAVASNLLTDQPNAPTLASAPDPSEDPAIAAERQRILNLPENQRARAVAAQRSIGETGKRKPRASEYLSGAAY